MADAEDIQPLVCDNGTGMVKVSHYLHDCFLVPVMSFVIDCVLVNFYLKLA